MRKANVCLRPESEQDKRFLLDLFLSIKDDFAGWRDLAPNDRTRVLTQQFEIQYQQYHHNYSGAWYTIITVDGIPAWRLYVWQMPKQLRLIDISLLPYYRQHGIGSYN